jgi:hypothetical protein
VTVFPAVLEYVLQNCAQEAGVGALLLSTASAPEPVKSGELDLVPSQGVQEAGVAGLLMVTVVCAETLASTPLVQDTVYVLEEPELLSVTCAVPDG